MALLLCSGILLLLGLVQHYLRAIPWTWLPSHLVAHRHGAQLSHQATTELMATVLQGWHRTRGALMGAWGSLRHVASSQHSTSLLADPCCRPAPELRELEQNALRSAALRLPHARQSLAHSRAMCVPEHQNRRPFPCTRALGCTAQQVGAARDFQIVPCHCCFISRLQQNRFLIQC